jgi:transposase InsO family protein
LGWALADHLRTELAIDARQMALNSRRPAPGLIHHSDSEDMSADVLGLPDPHSDGRVGTLVPGGA